MIRPLRRAHGIAWAALAIVLPLAFVTVLVGRRPQPLPTPAAPAWHAAPDPGSDSPIRPLEPVPLAVAIDTAGRARLVATGDPGTLPPGLLLYASDTAVAVGDALPEDARLLARAELQASFRRPPRRRALILYSVVHETVVGVAPGSGDRQ